MSNIVKKDLRMVHKPLYLQNWTKNSKKQKMPTQKRKSKYKQKVADMSVNFAKKYSKEETSSRNTYSINMEII